MYLITQLELSGYSDLIREDLRYSVDVQLSLVINSHHEVFRDCGVDGVTMVSHDSASFMHSQDLLLCDDN